MTIEETRALWERFKTADRTRDAELNRTVYAEDVVFLGTPLRGREALMKFDASFFAAFPDYRREILQEVVTADRIAFTYRYSATPTGEWLGMPATGLKLDVTGASMIAVRDGHFAEVQIARGLVQRIWIDMDLAGPLRQMATPLTGAKP